MTRTAGYGGWASPLAAGDVARAKVSLSELCSDGSAVYWLESRPSEGGRTVVVRADAHGSADHSPEGVSVRSRVNEYGGGALCLVSGHSAGAFSYVDQSDQGVWFCDGPAGDGAAPMPLSAPPTAGELHRHGGLCATADGDWVLAVRETHREGSARPVRSVVAFSTRGGSPCESTLLEGHDFFGTPRPHPDGDRLAVVAWDHPDMPWDASAVLLVPLDSVACAVHVHAHEHATLRASGPVQLVAGGAAESVGQSAWARDGSLRFVSDRTGWWQPYRHSGRLGTDEAPRPLTATEAEFHGPDWVLSQQTMAETAGGALVARMTTAGRDALVRLSSDGNPTPLAQPCVSIAALCAHGDGIALIGSTPDAPSTVWFYDPEGGARRLRPQAKVALGTGDVAVGEPFTLTGRSGRAVHGTLFRPTLGGTRGPAGTPPPLLTWCHGGPTSSCQAGLDLTLQFFTTRGFAVACVDYAGSSGYGRAYRNALWGLWGVADSEDCLDAALFLADRGDVDAMRMAIRGGSAGGMTALNALASGEGFGACVSWYGVADLLGLVATTHDFEAHYTDRLIGPLPGSHRLYEERSPVHRADLMRGSVLLLQGTEDPVVPPAQAESMRDALAAAGTSCDLEFFEGEGHGFRRADTLTACLEAELTFYLRQLHL
ncbi:MAG TPA: prolyl oligopeptidase family serine peptidase [Acidimicrobiales bacterium]